MSGKHWGHGFDRDVCEGCPKKVGAHEDSGNRLADAVMGAIASAMGKKVDRCGICGCSLVALERAKSPPEGCIRLDQHEGR